MSVAASAEETDPNHAYDIDYLHYMMQLETTLHEKLSMVYPEPLDKDTNEKRLVLVEWLLDVKTEYNLHAETLHQALNLLDRYLSTCMDRTPNKKLQCIAVTCMHLAAKFEEIYAPLISDMTYITDNTTSEDDIREAEKGILAASDFRFGRPTVFNFVRFWCHFYRLPAIVTEWACYYTFEVLAYTQRGKHLASQWAAACIELASRQCGIAKPVMHGSPECFATLRKLNTLLFENKAWNEVRPRHAVIATPVKRPLASSGYVATETAADTSIEQAVSPIR
jgi:hypothetical protein